jgi:uncharacterized protein YceK
MKKILGLVITLAALSGCSSAPKVQDDTKSGQEFQSAKINKATSGLVKYCDDWAKAYEEYLGKDLTEGFNECVELVIKNLEEKAQVKLSEKAPPAI